MNGRRSFLGWLISRPVLGVATVGAANAEMPANMPPVQAGPPSEMGRKIDLFRTALERRDNLKESLRYLPQLHAAPFPINIENKKSWSNAFKAHCYAHDKYNQPPQNVWTLSDQDLIDAMDRATPEFLKPNAYDMGFDK